MANPILVPETRDPSLWNRYGLLGAKIAGAVITGIAALMAMPVDGGASFASSVGLASNTATWSIGGVLAGLAIGAAAYAGCVKGASQIEHNRLFGRKIMPPTLMNDELAHGLLNGTILGLAAVTLVALSPLAAMTGAIAFTAGAAAMGAAFLGYYQADAQRDKMTRDYAQAQLFAQMQGQGAEPELALPTLAAPGKGQSKAPKLEAPAQDPITMKDIAALTAQLEAGRKPAAQRVMESQAMAAAAEAGR